MSEDSIERDGIKWGAEIAVDGKRPEWLEDEQLCMAQSDITGEWYQNGKAQPARDWGFLAVKAISLPADHPYYAQEKAAAKVDWSKPIEAVHVDGRVVPARTAERDDIYPSSGRYVVHFEGDGDGFWFLDNGKANIELDWHIRNVVEPAKTAIAQSLS